MPSRRRFYYYDEEAESFEEMMNPKPDEEYIDYRTYPIKINWPDVENPESKAYDIFEKYGYLGVALFNCISTIRTLKLTSDNFLRNILDFYLKNIEKNTPESLFLIHKLIKALPDLNSLRVLIIKENIIKKELLPFKIILDLYEHFLKIFDLPEYSTLLGEYMPVATIFYNWVSEEDFKYMYSFINSPNNRECYDLIIKMKSVYSKNKKLYLQNMNEMKSTLIGLIGGINSNKFCK